MRSAVQGAVHSVLVGEIDAGTHRLCDPDRGRSGGGGCVFLQYTRQQVGYEPAQGLALLGLTPLQLPEDWIVDIECRSHGMILLYRSNDNILDTVM